MTTPDTDDSQPATQPTPQAGAVGSDRRRGVFVVGDQVQLTDPKGRLHTITLEAGKQFHTHRGHLKHDDLIGAPDGSVIPHSSGAKYLALRPLLSDYVLSMPRGAQVVYPKDAGQIVQMGDIFPGAVVVEAGVGSGALSMSLLRAVGERGRLHSIEMREDFADIARANVRTHFGEDHPAWTVSIGDVAERLPEVTEPGSVDRVVLDLLAPWDVLDAAYDALTPGGVFLCYVATATQLSRVAEAARDHGGFTEPRAWESLVRDWHLEGLAVRPEHRMHAHTGFLLTTRRLAPDTDAPLRKRRPAKGAYGADYARPGGAATTADPTDEAPSDVAQVGAAGEWSAEDLGERPVSEKRIRRTRRAATGERPPTA